MHKFINLFQKITIKRTEDLGKIPRREPTYEVKTAKTDKQWLNKSER
jgi:hypothetical protein